MVTRAVPRLEAVLWWMVSGLAALWCLSSLWYPFGWDQGIFAWVGSVILDGGMPFRDAFDLKGPAAHYLFALAQVVFGSNLWGIRLLDLVGLLGVAWGVSRYTSKLVGQTAGRWAPVVLILWYGGLTFWHTAQPDGFAAHFIAIGLLALLSADDSAGSGRALVAGLGIGLAAAIKPNYAAFGLVPLLYFAWSDRGQPGRVLVRVAICAVGVIAVPAAFVGWFALQGALNDLWDVHILYNATTYSSGGSLAIEGRLRGLVEYVLAGNVFVVLLPAMLLGVVRIASERPAHALALTTWALLAVAGVVLQNKFFDYQWAPLLAPALILSVAGLDAARDEETGDDVESDPRTRFRLVHALSLVILVHASVHPAFEVLNWSTYMTGIRDEVAYYDTFGVPGDDLRMVNYLDANADPDDPLLVMAWNIEIQYMAGLPTVTRFGYSLPLWMGEGSEFQQKYRDEFMADIIRTPPEFVVVGRQALPLLGREVTLDEFPEFAAFLALGYERDVQFGDLTLFRRQ